MPEIKKLEPVPNVYKATFDDGSEQTLIAIDAAPALPSTRAQPARETAPEPEEKKPVKNPFSKKHYNLTEQARLKKRDPKEYERLKAAAAE